MIKKLLSLISILFALSNITLASNYYWVGGSGNWTDYAHHWAQSDNGNVFYSQIPGPLDNVFFTNNSLSGNTTVTLDQTIEACQNLTVNVTANSLNFVSNAVTPYLSIYGSASLSPMLTIASNISLYFEASSGLNTFNQNRAAMPCSLIFNNTGTWSLLDSINVYSLNFNEGHFISSGYKINTTSFNQSNTSTSIIDISNSLIETISFNLFDTQSKDVATGTKILINNLPGYYSNSITIQGESLKIDSVIINSTINGYQTINGDAHIHYLSLLNNSITLNYNGNIDHYNMPNGEALTIYPFESTTDTYLPLSIGVMNIGKLASMYIESSLTVDTFNYKPYALACGKFINIYGYGSFEGDSSKSRLNLKHIPVALNNCLFSNINASAYPINATSSINGGYNLGINIISPPSTNTLYRIGDGQWADSSKWSYSSNGPAAYCIPSPATNVIIDSNSFKNFSTQFIINGACKNITINTQKKNMVLGPLTCYGSFISKNPITYGGGITFLSSTNSNYLQFADTLNAASKSYISFNGSGTYYLESNIINCQGLINNTSNIHTNSYNINTGSLTLYGGTFWGYSSTIRCGSFTNMTDSASYHFEFTSFISQEFNNIMYTGNAIFGSIYISNYLYSLPLNTKHLILSGNVNVGYDIICDTLTIYKGSNIVSSNSITFSQFNTPGNLPCGKFTSIKGVYAPLNLISKNATTFDHFILENIIASGGGQFVATNSIDDGDNSGIIFTSNQPRTFYWIGNSGKWSDSTHWSLTSGGTPVYCLPSRLDNVVFDMHSSLHDTSRVTTDNYFECNNINISQSASFLLNNVQPLSVFGSFISNTNISATNINIEGNTPCIIQAPHCIFVNLTITKLTKTTFTNNFVISGQLSINQGSVEFHNLSCKLNNLSAIFQNKDSLIVTNSELVFTSQLEMNITNGLSVINSSRFGLQMGQFGSVYGIASNNGIANFGAMYFIEDSTVTDWSSSGVLLQCANVYIDTLHVVKGSSVPIDMQLQNTVVNNFIAFNNTLSMEKEFSMFFLPDTFNFDTTYVLIKNANIGAYRTTISNVTFDHLKIYPGNKLVITSGDTLFINKSLDITGAPSYPIGIESATNGTKAYIMNKGSVCGEYVYVQDNTVLDHTANAGFLSSNVSNNSGWNFNASCDTLLCSISQIPCSGDSVSLWVNTKENIVNPLWTGPRGFNSTSLHAVLPAISDSTDGFYTFSCKQGSCSVFVDALPNPVNNLINNIYADGSLDVENPNLNFNWYYNDAPIANNNNQNPMYYPTQTGYYRISTTSDRGCVYWSDSIYYMNLLDTTFRPVITSIVFIDSTSVVVNWKNIQGESNFLVQCSPAQSGGFFYYENVESGTATSSVFYNTGSGQYCFTVQGEYFNGGTLQSDTVCATYINGITTGITAGDKLSTVFYPNPTHGNKLNIKPGISSPYSIRIETIQGDQVFKQEGLTGPQQIQINLCEGIYMVHLISESYTISDKLIVSN